MLLLGGWVFLMSELPLSGDAPGFLRTRPTPIQLDHKAWQKWKVEHQGNSNSHGARPVQIIITMIKWIRTSRLSIKTLSLSTNIVRIWRYFMFKARPTYAELTRVNFSPSLGPLGLLAARGKEEGRE